MIYRCFMKKLVVLAVILLSACSSIPESLRVAESTNLVEFQKVNEASEEQLARWGGLIASVKNLKQGSMLEVVNMDLSASSSRPKAIDESKGRFRVYYKGLLDPVIYKEGRSVTVLGSVKAPEKGTIGEQEYVFPVLEAKHVHLWKEVKEVKVDVYAHPFTYSPYFHPYPRFYHPTRVIVKKSGQAPKPTKQSKAVKK